MFCVLLQASQCHSDKAFSFAIVNYTVLVVNYRLNVGSLSFWELIYIVYI